jgi:SAM-dependent methyltransferase
MPRSRHRWQGTSNYIADRGSAFTLAYGSIILCLVVIGLSTIAGWPAFIPLAFALMLVLSYFLAAAVWVAYQVTDRPGQRPVEVLLRMSQMEPGEKVVCIDLGLRETAVAIAQRLTTGTVSVIDVYNPQWNTSPALRRGRLRMQAHPAAADPRVEWLDGEIRLLPLPNGSVSAVFLNQVLGEFWQPEDRQTLLREAYRILGPGGRVLVAERVRSQINWLMLGPVGWGLATADEWHDLLAEAGFAPNQEKDIQGLVHCFQANKPTPTGSLQLPLKLDLD